MKNWVASRIPELLGFREKPASVWAWAIVVFFVVVSVTIFFLSYSLARHKRLVGELRAQIISMDAEKQSQIAEQTAKRVQKELAKLEEEKKISDKEKEKIRQQLEQKRKQALEEKATLQKNIKEVDRKSLQELIRQAEKLEKETL